MLKIKIQGIAHNHTDEKIISMYMTSGTVSALNDQIQCLIDKLQCFGYTFTLGFYNIDMTPVFNHSVIKESSALWAHYTGLDGYNNYN